MGSDLSSNRGSGTGAYHERSTAGTGDRGRCAPGYRRARPERACVRACGIEHRDSCKADVIHEYRVPSTLAEPANRLELARSGAFSARGAHEPAVCVEVPELMAEPVGDHDSSIRQTGRARNVAKDVRIITFGQPDGKHVRRVQVPRISTCPCGSGSLYHAGCAALHVTDVRCAVPACSQPERNGQKRAARAHAGKWGDLVTHRSAEVRVPGERLGGEPRRRWTGSGALAGSVADGYQVMQPLSFGSHLSPRR